MQTKLADFFQGSSCVVTGGTGMIGREVAVLLRDFGASVTVVSLDKIDVGDGISHVFGDLTDFEFCLQQTADVDYVFHVAGIKGSIDVTKARPASFLVPLLMFNTNVLEAARKNGVKRLVYTSSIGAYSSAEVFRESEYDETQAPMDHYPGWAKRIAELQIKAYEIEHAMKNFSIVRPCNVYGPGDNFDPENAMVIPSLMARINSGENPLKVWGDGSALRDFAFSRDVAMGVIQSLYFQNGSNFLNLGSGVAISIRELVETLRQVVAFDFEFDATKPAGFPKRVMDISKARELINYRPETSLLEGLKETWDWFQKNTEESQKRKNYFSEDVS